MARKKKPPPPPPPPSGVSGLFRTAVWLTVCAGIAVLAANVVTVSDLGRLKSWRGHPVSPERRAERGEEPRAEGTHKAPGKGKAAARPPRFEGFKEALREKIRRIGPSAEPGSPGSSSRKERHGVRSPHESPSAEEAQRLRSGSRPTPAADGPPPTPPGGRAGTRQPERSTLPGSRPAPRLVPQALTRAARLAALRQVTLPSGLTAGITGGEPAAGLAANEIARGHPQRPRVALTFDADWDSQPTTPILNTLQKKKASATFFLTGRWAERNPDLVRRIVRDGHELANHSYSHPHFPELAADKILEQVTKTDQIFYKLTGQAPAPYVRLPYGDRDNASLRVLIGQGYVPIYWSLDTHDWQEQVTGKEVLRRVVGNVQKGDIILLHATTPKTAEVLPQILTELEKKGYACGTVSSVLAP